MNRFKLLWLVFLGMGSLLVFRLIDVQLIRGEDFRQLANDNRFFTIRIPPERGIFTDRYGQPLSLNKRIYYQVADITAIQPQQLPISREKALNLLATSSAQVRFAQERLYQFPQATAHVLGYVGPVTAEDLTLDTSLKVSDLVGKTGLEKNFDQQLRGTAGFEVYEINSLGIRQRLVEQSPGKPGKSYATSLDPYLSQISLLALGDQSGAVVIMDGDTGQVLTLVSSPSFDANSLSTRYLDPAMEKQRQQQLQQLLTDERQVMFNRAVAGAYPPGSIFKIVTALGGLEGQAIDATTTVNDEGTLKVGEYEYANWYFTQFGGTEGEISLQRAIARSNDIFFYKVAELLGPDKLAAYARLFGLGSITGIELGGEATGLVPDPAWKEKVIGEPWYLGNTFHFGIGQGDILVTPLQIAQLTQAVANQGEMCRPSLLKDQPEPCASLGFTQEQLDLVLNGMLDVCSAGGTAFPFFSYNQTQRQTDLTASNQIQNGAIACKTGTAEFGGQDERGFRSTHGWLTAVVGTSDIVSHASASGQLLNNELRNEWFQHLKTGDFPDKLVIVALVESDENQPYKEGSRDGGAVVKQILDWMMGVATPQVSLD